MLSEIDDAPVGSRRHKFQPGGPPPHLEVFHLTGEFDASSVQGLSRSIEDLGTVDRIHLDFSRVSRFSDRGVAALAASLAVPRRGPEVIFHGLLQHQIRLFRYFGLEVDRPVSAGRSEGLVALSQ